ncbi:hypothetical protein J7K93_04960 [bacterium]|nr:hypothetical protein [bacterium]
MALPVTEKLYYTEPYEHLFTARVLSVTDKDGSCDVVIDRTLFFPEGGGQPCDTGVINGMAVVDVREENGVIIHTVKGRLTQGEAVHGDVSWERRFDHMQQHTGQHILSQSFLRIYGAKTVGFHLGRNFVTIDLDREITDREQLEQAEHLVNNIVFENRKVKNKEIASDEIASYNLRKFPPIQDTIRVVEIEDFDLCACCGTHVSATGETGPVKIVKTERYKGGSRISFVCGGRALNYFTHVSNIVQDISLSLDTGYNELVHKVSNLNENYKSLKRKNKHTEERLLDYIADSLLSGLQKDKEINIIDIFDENISFESLRILVRKLVNNSGIIAVAGTKDDKSHVVLASSKDVDIDLGKWFDSLITKINGKGGGPDSFKQGSGELKTDLNSVIRDTAENIKSQVLPEN